MVKDTGIGALVCVATADGKIVLNRPYAYDAMKQGDSPAWLGMLRKAGRLQGDETHESAESNVLRTAGVLQHR